jgi:hypothetical protein
MNETRSGACGGQKLPVTRRRVRGARGPLERAATLCHPLGAPLSKRTARHSYKLWHRAPSESDRSPIGLSHVGQTLESGVPAPPRSTSLDAAGQWLVCGAGTSPTEIPRNHEPSDDAARSRTAGILASNDGRVKTPDAKNTRWGIIQYPHGYMIGPCLCRADAPCHLSFDHGCISRSRRRARRSGSVEARSQGLRPPPGRHGAGPERDGRAAGILPGGIGRDHRALDTARSSAFATRPRSPTQAPGRCAHTAHACGEGASPARAPASGRGFSRRRDATD